MLVGAAATPPDLAERARRAGARLLLSYGMSETTGGCVYDGRALDGLTVRLRDGDQRVLVSGPSVFAGYRQQPELTAEVLVDGWLVTPDLGRWADDGRLEILGRADDIVVSGGENVSPVAVAHALRSHPGVADAAVVGVPDPEWGQAVVAYVVAAGTTCTPDPDDLRAHVREQLGRAAVPRQIVIVDSLPMLASGKVDRAALADRAATAGA